MVTLLSFAAVAAGGALGACLRYGAMRLVPAAGQATLLVNVLGSLAMGVLAAWLLSAPERAQARLFLGTGLLGGFTTFSAFSLEALTFLQAGQYVQTAGYVAANVTLSLIAVAAGFSVFKALFS